MKTLKLLFNQYMFLVLAVTLAASVFANDNKDTAKDKKTGLQYRLLGPAAGGRSARVVGIPDKPLIYYLATAAGGVWKSSNGGLKWESVFDDQPVSSTGSVAVGNSNPNIVYVGSGEANIRGNTAKGNGIYRSLDAGKNWQHVLKIEGQIGTIVVHPQDDNTVFAAVLGSPFGPGEERGIYRSTDGGQSWQRVLHVDQDTGASDIAFDELNPNVLFAGMWQTRRTPWGMTSGGPGSGLYLSRDGGDNWKKLQGDGLPDGIWGKVGVRVAPTDSNRVYALIEAKDGGLFRSDDGGDKWQHVSDNAGLKQRAWYYSTLTVDPTDADTVWFPQVPMLKTIDGGHTVLPVLAGGWDHHDVWIDPQDPQRIAEASDAGVSLSWDGGKTWVRPPLAIGQFYHLSVDSRTPYRVMGSLQDFGTRSGPSNSLHEKGIFLSDWKPVGGGEAGFVVAEPDDPGIVWAGEYMGYISRYNDNTGQAPHVGIFPDNGSGHGDADQRHRFQWTAPIIISPHDPKLVYHASNTLQRTRDGGQSWEIISPDLTRNDASKQQWSGGPITGDNTGVEYYGTLFSVAESPVQQGVIWTGSDDGLVHVSRDDGKNWDDVTPHGAPHWGTVEAIETSHWDAGKAYVVFNAHRLDDDRPYVFRTDNYGRSWQDISTGLDEKVHLHVLRSDTQKRDLLFLGTERGVMVSHDDGASWTSLRLNMPTVAIADMTIAGNDLVVGTLGRSAYSLDDLTPIREMSDKIASQTAQLFKPLPAIRWHYAAAPEGSRAGATSNPPRGALISYHLAEKAKGEIKLEVLDAGGTLVRTLSSVLEPPYIAPDSADADPSEKRKAELENVQGLNRAAWDLSYQGATRIPGSTNDAGDINVGPPAPPGVYTLRLSVAGETFEQPLTVVQDPRSSAKPEDIQAQTRFLLDVRDRISAISAAAIRIRAIRAQLDAYHKQLGDDPQNARLLALGITTSTRLHAIELALYSPEAKVNYDILAGREGGAKLYSRLGWLYLSSLDHSGPPTQGMLEVNAELTALYQHSKADLEDVLKNDVTQLNALAKELGVNYIVQ